jgi:hypothetical protein
LLENVALTTSARDPSGTYTYGPFTNKSPYALTLVLNHQGGNKERHHYIWVNNVMVSKSVNADTTAPVIIQPYSTYRWEVQDSYRVTAWILSDEVELNTRVITQKTELPYRENFENPVRIVGPYLGCISYYVDRYAFISGALVLVGSQSNGIVSYYEALAMTDGSSSALNAEYLEEFGTYAAKGAIVKNAGACFERRSKDEPATDNSGGV